MPRSTPMRTLVAAACAALAWALTPVAHGAADAPSLDGGLRISGDRPGGLGIAIGRELRVIASDGEPADLRVAIESPAFAAVVLRATRLDADGFRPAFIAATAGSSARLVTVGYPELPAGAYDAYLLADRPATVTLRVADGVPVEVRPAYPVAGSVSTFAGRAEPVATFGTDFELTSEGLMYTQLAAEGEDELLRSEGCLYSGDGPVPQHLPGCPGGESFPLGDDGAALFPNEPAGRYALGGNLAARNLGTGFSGVIASLTYRPVAGPYDPASPAPSPPPVQTPGTVTLPRRAVVDVRSRRPRLVMPAGCRGADGQRCDAAIRLRGSSRTHRLQADAGQRDRVVLPLPARLVRELRRHGRAVAHVEVHEGSGTKRHRVVLRRAPARAAR